MEKFFYFKLVFLFRLDSTFLTERSKYDLFLRTSSPAPKKKVKVKTAHNRYSKNWAILINRPSKN